MDALDKFILEAELIHGWRATAIHEFFYQMSPPRSSVHQTKRLRWGVRDPRAMIALNRHSLSDYPRSASRWLDLSLGHAVLGNRIKSLACMRAVD